VIGELGHLSFYWHARTSQLYAIACHRCERQRPAEATFMVATHGTDWRTSGFDWLLSHLHAREARLMPMTPLPFPDRET
jgi:hypothetical protein